MRFIENLLKFLSKFSRKFREKFRKFWKYACRGGSGAEPSEASEIIKNIVEKSMETCILLKIFINYESMYFLFKKLILIIIKVSLVGY